jgi:hypothetical protein
MINDFDRSNFCRIVQQDKMVLYELTFETGELK